MLYKSQYTYAYATLVKIWQYGCDSKTYSEITVHIRIRMRGRGIVIVYCPIHMSFPCHA